MEEACGKSSNSFAARRLNKDGGKLMFEKKRRIYRLAQTLKDVPVGKTKRGRYLSVGKVNVARTERGAEIGFENGLFILTEDPLWELYLAEVLITTPLHSSENYIVRTLKCITKKCFITRNNQKIDVDNHEFFINCILRHENPLIMAVLKERGELDA
jgi:hypothetical protein